MKPQKILSSLTLLLVSGAIFSASNSESRPLQRQTPQMRNSAIPGVRSICKMAPNNPDGLLVDGFAEIYVNGTTLRFRQFDTITGTAVLLRDYLFVYKGMGSPNSVVKNMHGYKLEQEIQSYGDSMQRMYIDPSLGGSRRLRQASGRLTFPWQSYRYDWNVCTVQ